MPVENRDETYIENLSKELTASLNALSRASMNAALSLTRGLGIVSRWGRDETVWWTDTFKKAAATTKDATVRMAEHLPFRAKAASAADAEPLDADEDEESSEVEAEYEAESAQPEEEQEQSRSRVAPRSAKSAASTKKSRAKKKD